MSSGHDKKDYEIDPRTPYSIWLNPELDENGVPINIKDQDQDQRTHGNLYNIKHDNLLNV